MIIIYTNYDQVSDTLARCAEALADAARHRGPRVLGPPEGSKAAQIRAELTSGAAPVFFFGHGASEPYGLISQDQLPFIEQHDSRLLAGRLICATCCHSVTALKQAVINFGATVVGYDGRLAVPYGGMYFEDLRRAVLSGPLALLEGRTAGEVCGVLRDEFNALAQELIKGTIEDQVLAVFMSANADLVKLLGDSEKTM